MRVIEDEIASLPLVARNDKREVVAIMGGVMCSLQQTEKERLNRIGKVLLFSVAWVVRKDGKM